MKRLMFGMIGLGLWLASCKKESALTPEVAEDMSGKKYAVKFYTAGFVKETKDMAWKSQGNAVSGLSDKIKSLSCYIYKGNRDSLTFVKAISQDANDPSFGTINDSLTAGKYKVFFVGSTSTKYKKTYSVLSYVTWYYHPALEYPDAAFGDTFVKNIDLNVTQPQSQNIELKRAVAQVTFKFLDKLPPKADRIVITYENPFNSFVYDLLDEKAALTGSHYDWYSRMEKFNIKVQDRGKANLEFSSFVWGDAVFTGLYIDVYAGDVLLRHKPLAKEDEYLLFKVAANTQYILSGNLSDPDAVGFKINVDDKWNPPVNIPFDVKQVIREKRAIM